MSRQRQRWPDFFIVGAPRCGTTFLWTQLGRQPGVFLPRLKEPLYFCADLNRATKSDRRYFITDADEYLAHFVGAPANAILGEGCPFNLFSSVAAERIAAVRPDARIVISLRDPVEQMVSFHATRLADGAEELPFAAAIDAQQQRARGERLPAHPHIVPAYAYTALAAYAIQVERYLAAFPREQVLVLLFDDLRADPARVVERVARFVGVERPRAASAEVVNPRKRVRFERLARLMRSKRVIAASKRVVPHRLHPPARAAADLTFNLNQRPTDPEPIDADLERELRALLRPDVEHLSELLGTDLVRRWKMEA